MKYDILFMLHKNTFASNPLAPIFDNYDWWLDLVKEALQVADEFEMRLWGDDVEGIKSGEKFGNRVPNDMTKEIVFRGEVTSEFRDEILTNYLNDEGYIKWFTLNLLKDDVRIFSSSHYGDETIISVETLKQVNKIKDWAKNYPIIWRVDVYECEY